MLNKITVVIPVLDPTESELIEFTNSNYIEGTKFLYVANWSEESKRRELELSISNVEVVECDIIKCGLLYARMYGINKVDSDYTLMADFNDTLYLSNFKDIELTCEITKFNYSAPWRRDIKNVTGRMQDFKFRRRLNMHVWATVYDTNLLKQAYNKISQFNDILELRPILLEDSILLMVLNDMNPTIEFINKDLVKYYPSTKLSELTEVYNKYSYIETVFSRMEKYITDKDYLKFTKLNIYDGLKLHLDELLDFQSTLSDNIV